MRSNLYTVVISHEMKFIWRFLWYFVIRFRWSVCFWSVDSILTQGRLIEAVMNDTEEEAMDCVKQGADCNQVNKVSHHSNQVKVDW